MSVVIIVLVIDENIKYIIIAVCGQGRDPGD